MKLNSFNPAESFSGVNIRDIAAPLSRVFEKEDEAKVTPEYLKQLFSDRGYLKLWEASVLRKFQIRESLSRNSSNIFTFGTIGMGLAAFVSRIFSANPNSESSIARKLELLAKRATSTTLAIYAIIAGHKAVQNKDAALGVSQLSEMIVPMMSDTENLTINRGFGIALNTIAIEAKKFFDGHKFESFGQSVDALKGALQEVSEKFLGNPLKTIIDFKNGPGTILASVPVLVSPLLKLLGVNDKFVYMARSIPGAVLELGKVAGSLKRGAPLYFASGVNMMISSALNLVGGFMPEARKSLEMLTWSFNLLGRLLLVKSIKNDEIKSTNTKPVSISELPQIVLRELFAKTELEKIPPVLNLSSEDANKPFVEAARNATLRHYEEENAKSRFFHSTQAFSNLSKPSSMSELRSEDKSGHRDINSKPYQAVSENSSHHNSSLGSMSNDRSTLPRLVPIMGSNPSIVSDNLVIRPPSALQNSSSLKRVENRGLLKSQESRTPTQQISPLGNSRVNDTSKQTRVS